MGVLTDWVCIVQLELPRCQNTFGQGACTATGIQCNNTYRDCLDPCNYACGGEILSFSTCVLPAHLTFCAHPFIDGNSFQRSRIKPIPGRSFSNNRFISMTINDGPTDGSNLDPYWPRGAIPIRPENSPGSFLGRLEQIHKSFKGYKATVLTGYCNQHISEFRREIFVIDSFEGVADACDGSFQLRLIDPLSLAGDAQIPNGGQCWIATSAIGNEYLSTPRLGVDLGGIEEQPYLWYGSPILAYNLADNEDNRAKLKNMKYIRIGSEILRVQVCINDSVPQGFNVELIERGACGSEISSHTAGDDIFFGVSYENCHLVDVIRDMFCNHTDLNNYLSICCDEEQFSIINDESFENYRCNNPRQFIEFILFTKSVSLRKMLNELELLFGFSLKINPECGDLEIRDCRPPIDTGRMLMKEEIETINITKGEDYQAIYVEYAPINCADAISGDNVGRRDLFTTDDALKKPCARLETRKINTKSFSTAWITQGNAYALKAAMWRLLQKHRCAMRYPVVRVANLSAEGIEEGDGLTIQHGRIQDRFGEYDTETLFGVVGVFPGKEFTDICLEESPYPRNTVTCIDDSVTVQPATIACELQDCPVVF